MGEPSSDLQGHDSMLSNGTHPNSYHEFFRAAIDGALADPIGAATQVSETKYFIVAVDFGTTFSSVSVHCRRDRESDIDSSQINSISNYPYAASVISQGPSEVPTQSWYPKNLPFRRAIHTEKPYENENELDYNRLLDEDGSTTDGPMPNNNHEDDNHVIDSEDLMDTDEDEYGFMDEDNEIVDRYYWGYGVSEMLATDNAFREQSRRIVRSKLLLDRSVHTKHIRKQLSGTVKDLHMRKLIRDETDLIADFLMHLLRHTREQMELQYDYHSNCSVEFVLCVPAMWTEKACRAMQNAMTRALRESEFIDNSNHDVDNLFIVTEPEAASTYVLDKSREITPGECFLLLDAGGGTVDAITYKVRSKHPLRLEREEFEPEGALCGSSYLNEEFEKLLWRRLASHPELEQNGMTLRRKIHDLVQEFETKIKRRIDIYSDDYEGEALPITGLIPSNNEKYIHKHRLIVSKNNVRSIFLPCLEGVSNLMFSQLEKAEKAGVVINKVILIGGFSSSPSLARHIQRHLNNYSTKKGFRIPLISTPVASPAVAHGAVLRAANKADGPERRVRSSFGILRTEHYEPTTVRAHQSMHPWHDPLDGEKYIKKTIDWVVNKGDLLPSGTVITRHASHTFPVEPGIRFICEEILFISSKPHESHYRRSHPKNKGHEQAGHILVDMTFLKDDPDFCPVKPAPGGKGQIHYRVEFDLVIKINGRNLRFEARYPGGENGILRGERQFSIAASFQPGTE